MDLHCAFETRAFDDPPAILSQSVNRIHGKALADYLARQLKSAGFDASEPWAEDHGWDFAIAHSDARWLVACAVVTDGDEDEEAPEIAPPGADGVREGHVSLLKVRSLADKLRGRNRFDVAEPIPATILTALSHSADVANLQVEI